MANYILSLREQAGLQAAAHAATLTRINEFRVHLMGSKFIGTDPDGSRRDWISTADAERWLLYILDGEQAP